MELLPLVNPNSTEPLYIQLYRHIRGEIEAGRLMAGAKLPSVRKLASHLNISRTPVQDAYQQLLAEGYIESRPRSGLYVNVQPYEGEFSLPPAVSLNKASAVSSVDKTSPEADRHHSPSGRLPGVGWIDFAYGDVDLEHFPYALWKRLLGRCFRPAHRGLFRYGDPLGEQGFREAVADYAYRARAVVCPPERLLAGAGTHHSLEQLLRLLRGTRYSPDRTPIAVEQAMSDGMSAIMRQYGYTLHPIRLEPDGICVEEAARTGASLVYTTPSHQFPYGQVMSYGKRRQLLQWAEQTGALIIEDDYDGEFRYAGNPIPSLQGLDAAAGTVAYIGTFSRALTPAFRLSYLALPEPLADQAREALHPFDRLASPLHQKTLELFITEGHMQRHIRKMRSVYQRKLATLLAAYKQRLEPYFHLSGGSSGLHVLLAPNRPAACRQGANAGGPTARTGQPGTNAERSVTNKAQAEQERLPGNVMVESRLVQLAYESGVRVYPTSVYRIGVQPDAAPAVLLGFGGLDERQIEEGINRLADAWLDAGWT